MSLKPSIGPDRTLPDPGIHVARLVACIDQGTQQGVWGGKPKVLLGWELPNEDTYEYEGEVRACMIWQSYTASLGTKANLRKMLEGWRGRPYNGDELQRFNFADNMDQPCQIGVVHSECGQYANLGSVNPIGTAVCPKRITPLVFFDLDDPNWALFDTFSEKMQNKIKETPEYQQARLGPVGDDHGRIDQHREEEQEIPF